MKSKKARNISRKIVAIGGGWEGPKRRLQIYGRIAGLARKKRAWVLIIPTASYDTHDWDQVLEDIYVRKLGCQLDFLRLLSDRPSFGEIRRKIAVADVIYVPGGNTLKMMRLWRRLGVDRLLKKAWRQGTVLAGVSAGSICWFDSGHSDSLSHYNSRKWKYINVRGLGLIRGINCPHYDDATSGKKRKDDFAKMMMRLRGDGVAIDNDCAIEFIDDGFRVFSAKKSAKAYRVYTIGRNVLTEVLPVKKAFTPIDALYGGGA